MDYSEIEDRKLAVWAADGQERAFRELVERFQRPIFSLVYRMVRDRTLAEDLAQDTFVRAYSALDSYDPSYKFSSWIFKIANNLTIDHLRKKKLDTVSLHGSPHAESEEEAERSAVVLEAESESPEQYVEARELGDRIEEAIGSLRPEYRTAILLRHVEGHSYDEIAEIMELPLGTVKTYLHRARNELRELLEGC